MTSGPSILPQACMSLIAYCIGLRPVLMRSDWEDRKGRFPIHYPLFYRQDMSAFDSGIEFVVFI